MKLPLFPLHNVLFPGMPLRLHIFEPRYKLLVQHCLADGLPFGVVLIAAGHEALGPLPEPHSVGCTARINYLEPLGDGRSNLLAVGHERFRIRHLRRDGPYLTAQVETLSLSFEGTPRLTAHTERTRALLDRYLRTLGELGQWQEGELAPSHSPTALAHLACGALQIPNEEKQDLLATEDLLELLGHLERLLQRELALLNLLAVRGLERLERSSNLN